MNKDTFDRKSIENVNSEDSIMKEDDSVHNKINKVNSKDVNTTKYMKEENSKDVNTKDSKEVNSKDVNTEEQTMKENTKDVKTTKDMKEVNSKDDNSEDSIMKEVDSKDVNISNDTHKTNSKDVNTPNDTHKTNLTQSQPSTQSLNSTQSLYQLARAFMFINQPDKRFFEQFDDAMYRLKYLVFERPISFKYGNTGTNLKQEISFQLTNVQFNHTSVTPDYCFYHKSSYTFTITADVVITLHRFKFQNGVKYTTSDKSDVIRNVFHCNIPCPIGSKYCATNYLTPEQRIISGLEYEPYNGYFIINGNMNHLLTLISVPFNRTLIFTDHTESLYSDADFNQTVFNRININKDRKNNYDLTLSILSKSKNYKLDDRHQFPLKLVFTALGYVTDKQVIDLIEGHLDSDIVDFIRKAFIHGHVHKEYRMNYSKRWTQNYAQYIIGDTIITDKSKAVLANKEGRTLEESLIQIGRDMIKNFVVSFTDNFTNKATQIMTCIQRLYLVHIGKAPESDRNSMYNRRYRNCENLFRDVRSLYQHAVKIQYKKYAYRFSVKFNEMEHYVREMFDNVGKYVNEALIDAFMNQSESNVSTNLQESRNTVNLRNKLREIIIESNVSDGADVPWDQRAINDSEMFYICPTQTPEAGANTGRFKSQTMFAFYTRHTRKEDVEVVLKRIKMCESFTVEPRKGYYSISINEVRFGFVNEKECKVLYKDLMKMRDVNEELREISVILNHNKRLFVYYDGGRMMTLFARPSVLKDVSYLESPDIEVGLERGYIQYMCPEMCVENAVVASSMTEYLKNPRVYTHIALPNHIHGYFASSVSGLNLNAGVRASYSTNHTRQALGIKSNNPELMTPALETLLLGGQKPLVRTMNYDLLPNTRPYGQNIIVAFMQFRDNQEDGLIMNKNSVKNGMFEMVNYTTSFRYKEDDDVYEYVVPEICEEISPGGPIMWKCHDNNMTEISNPLDKDLVVCMKNEVLENNDVFIGVTYQFYTEVEHGDKFNTEHAQKGTCCKVLDPEDLPYNKDGVRPDIIFNPPAIFKRKTYGQMYYSVLAKLAGLECCPLESTPYHSVYSMEDLETEMKRLGFEESGNEVLYDPVSGRSYESKIWMGSHYFERQPHIAANKLNVRNNGPRDWVSGQPTKGRRKFGGQTLDRMTLNAHIASGMMYSIRDAKYNQGSSHEVGVCKKCGNQRCYLQWSPSNGCDMWCCGGCGMHHEIEVKIVPIVGLMIDEVLKAYGFTYGIVE